MTLTTRDIIAAGYTLDGNRWVKAKPTTPRAIRGTGERAKRKAKALAGMRGMNKWESEYADQLTTLKLAGVVKWFAFEAVKLRLADATYYIPDFIVSLASGQIEIHEVKGGFARDDSIVKFKVAAEIFECFVFKMITKRAGAFVVTRELNAKE